MSTRKSSLFDMRAGAVDALHLALKTADIAALQAALQQRFDAAPEFFAGDAVVLDLRRLDDDARLDVNALATWLTGLRLRPIGVVANEAQAGWAAASLPRLDSHAVPRKPPTAEAAEAADSSRATPQPGSAAPGTAPPSARSGATAGAAQPQAEAEPAHATLLIDKPLRSGQRVYTPGDLIVLDVVSHGAEIIAGGNIHVYAPLRGRALAGAHGAEGARIFSTCFEPELVAIAGVYRTADQPLPASVMGKPAHVLLDGSALRIEALKLK
ncbi:MAG: septum site-determining protein MinC [Betaproteobacteria bacterium]|nr:septum site-determining protein MinC [Betaproteobacteria bacterium]MDE2123498.1 septum site-determining protein MinC [Betaproteobacteria bacterium]